MGKLSAMNTELLKSTLSAINTVAAGDATQEQVLTALNFLDALKEATRQLGEQLEPAVIKWIEGNGELSFGEIRYYVGANKTTKCKDLTETAQALLEAGGVETLVRGLSTSAFKHGTCRELLGDAYGKLFETTEVQDLKTGVAKPKRLQKVNERFQ